ncbi:ABC transporter ATP-binding protein [Streptomyces sp. NPDC000410]|uniref:ABC transporter ATP-binding protein n=1 Tax=Streptomyces sp. NPDC000410 TaxID=3154254 RepID=UPI003332C205
MNMLQVSGVSKSFRGLKALDEVSVAVRQGSVVGLVGPNGAGKSTLVNLVSGYLAPDNGTILMAGCPATGLRPDQLAARGVARTYQNLRLFEETTVVENLLLGRHRAFRGRPWQLWSRRRTEERERRVALDLVERVGLGVAAHENVTELSYGSRRRVEIARALATEPHLLLLDEPTAGMTRREADEIGALIREINREAVTVVLVEHNVRLVSEVCDEVVVLEQGRVVTQAPAPEVWDDPRVRRAYLGADGEGER